ncbi:MAG: S1/P1 nuclease [Pyrinomonadaceae bacterium]
MTKKTRVVSFLFIFTVFCTFPAMAWDDVGHKITAYIAWQRMSSTARDNAIQILRAAPEDAQLSTFYFQYGAQSEDARRRTFFMTASTWPDIVRDRAFVNRVKKYHKGNWHYDDYFWKQSPEGKVELLNGMPEGGHGIEKLADFEKILRNPESPNTEKALAIAWMLHIGGDIHQPLHTSGRVTELELKGDQGGNLFLLTPQGTTRENQVNLHWFWDSIVGRNVPNKDDACDGEYVDPIAEKILKGQPFSKFQDSLSLADFEVWKKESFSLNATDVYSPDLVRNQMPSKKYRKNAYKVAQRQLAVAGYRLGEKMNQLLGTAIGATVK